MSESNSSTPPRRPVYHLTLDLKAQKGKLRRLQEPEVREKNATEIGETLNVIKRLEGQIEDRRKELIAKQAARDGYMPPQKPPQDLLDAIAALEEDFKATSKELD